MTKSIPVFILAVSTAVLLFCVFSYMYWDRALLETIRTMPDAWIQAGTFISRLGKAEWYLVPALVFLLFNRFIRYHRNRYCGAMVFCWAIVVAGLVNSIIKFMLGRYRPVKLFHDGLYGFGFFQTKASCESMPSGHCNTVAAAATILWFVYPPLRPLYVAWVGLMMEARVMATAHYPSDVVAGVYTGMVAAFITYRVMRNSSVTQRRI